MTVGVAWLMRASIGLLPALCFLGALLLLDSYKLVRLRLVTTIIGAGGAVAVACYVVNASILRATDMDFGDYSRYVAPLIEEALKGSVIIALIRTRRIGFLVDASVLGYAVGAGFATVENIYYLSSVADPHFTVWIVRGLGTAILHGGMQAIFAAMVLHNADLRGKLDARAIVPPLLLVTLVHAAFNQFVLPPMQETLLVLMCIPPLMLWVFLRSERAVEGWIGSGFEVDQELLELLDSGKFSDSRAGQYLYAMRERFTGEVVADLLCYLRLYVELALRAKGILMMREHDIEVPIDAETKGKLQEMRYLERTVGPTAMRTLNPLMHMNGRDLWQLYMLGK
jgi:RsiW-degrading membrane proteinase PrsW (M82 family)